MDTNGAIVNNQSANSEDANFTRKIRGLNDRAKALNDERQRVIGGKESARNDLDRKITAYQAKYNVLLDDTNFQTEYDRVATRTSEAAKMLEDQIARIESGEYRKKFDESGTSAQTPAPAPAPVMQGQAPAPAPEMQQQMAQPPIQFVGSAQPNYVAQDPTQQQYMDSPTMQQPVAPMQQQMAQPPMQMGVIPNGGTPEQDVADAAFTPAGWGNADGNLTQPFQGLFSGAAQFGANS